jgi:hypothetical protein
VLVPGLIFLVCFGAGIVASAQWLPELAQGPVGGLAFFATCGLLAAALGLAGLHAYSIVNELGHPPLEPLGKAEILAGGLRNLLLGCGTLLGLASIVYLLAPGLDEEVVPTTVNDSEGGTVG